VSSDNKLIAAIPSGKGELRVELAHYQGGKFAALRKFTASGAPTKQGMTLSLWNLPELITALQDLQAEVKAESKAKGKASNLDG